MTREYLGRMHLHSDQRRHGEDAERPADPGIDLVWLASNLRRADSRHELARPGAIVVRVRGRDERGGARRSLARAPESRPKRSR